MNLSRSRVALNYAIEIQEVCSESSLHTQHLRSEGNFQCHMVLGIFQLLDCFINVFILLLLLLFL